MGVWGIHGDKTNVISAPNYQMHQSNRTLWKTMALLVPKAIKDSTALTVKISTSAPCRASVRTETV